jgi:DNA-binding NarL/FixJ family response regulator
VAIAIASDANRNCLTALVRSLRADVIAHQSLGTLRESLIRGEVDLVITDVTLPDGNWVDVLRLAVEVSPPPVILVHSRVVHDRLWSEVLWRGAHYMLIAPYSYKDGCEIIESALRAAVLARTPACNLETAVERDVKQPASPARYTMSARTAASPSEGWRFVDGLYRELLAGPRHPY